MNMDFLNNLGFYASLSTALKAVILLIVALIAAAVARVVVKKILVAILARTSQSEMEDVEIAKQDTVKVVGNITYAVVFMLFLPGALDMLHVSSVSAPISSMTTKFLNYLPNIIASILVILFGAFLAKLAKQIILMLLAKTKLDALQEKCGVKDAGKNTFSNIIGNIAYALIIVIFVVASLQILNLKSISGPATSMVEMLLSFVPLIFAATIIVFFGIFLANIVSSLLGGVLAGTGIDDKTEGLFPKNADGDRVTTASKLIAIIVNVVINIFFVVAAIDVLKIDVLSNIGQTIIKYMPNVLAAVIIVIIAWILANKASAAIIKAEAGTLFAVAAKYGIIVLAGFMALSQLGIASNIVHWLFLAIIGATAVAAAIAFGVGGRDWAAKKLDEMDKTFKKKKK
jgi:hypothetical protein